MINPAPGQPFQPRAHPLVERGRTVDREAELHGGRDLVHVLAARAARADELLLELALVEGDRWGDGDHDGDDSPRRSRPQMKFRGAARHCMTSAMKPIPAGHRNAMKFMPEERHTASVVGNAEV